MAAVLGLTILASTSVLAADRDQPTQVEADHLLIDDESATSIYSGGVKLQRGSLRVDADKVTIKSPADSSQTMLILGQPAHFRQRPEGENQDVRGEADRIDYDVDSQQLILRGKARLWRSGDQFNSEKIEYNGKSKQVRAGDPDSKSRVHITIQPKPNNH